MKTRFGNTVHPWYKRIHEWEVKGIPELDQSIDYDDSVQGRTTG